MKRTLEKRIGNTIELRDYDVEKAIANNEKIEVTYEKEVMTLSPKELVAPQSHNPSGFKTPL